LTAGRGIGRLSNPGLPWLALTVAILSGCGPDTPRAAVEGTLRMHGKPLDNCLVTFLPEPGQEARGTHSTGLTDTRGFYRLRGENKAEAVATGWQRVTVQDLSVSTGIRRRDHGSVDMDPEETAPPPPVQRSRVPERYASWLATPLRREVKPGHQVIDLDLP
jgi:hypothetical protein